VTAFDFADRPSTLLARRPGKPDQPLVSGSTYLPSGPLASLTFGNGLTETHTFTNRYFPSAITLAGASNVLSWTYTTDNEGNVLAIADTLSPANNRTYGYLDNLYFLTRGDGPWGTRSWSYDKIGNRLTEVRVGVTDSYSYQPIPPPGTGHTPLLTQIQLGAGGTRAYQFDIAGNLKKITSGTETLNLVTDEAGRLAALERPALPGGVSIRYDGRDFLAMADSEALPFQNGFETGDLCAWSGAVGLAQALTCPPPHPAAQTLHSSEGILHAVTRNHAPESSFAFRFAGRPVAQLDLSGGTESWKFLTTDHLGTPIAATAVNTTLLWQGGLEPFGADWSGAASAGIFLRFPGQWEDTSWTSVGSGFYENVHRWYQPGTGRYTSPDPWQGTKSDPHAFAYVNNKPLIFTDPLGLRQFPFGAGQFCGDRSCGCKPPFKVLGEDSPSFLPSAPFGCVDADAVYTRKCVVKIPDNFSCVLQCDPGAPAGEQGTLICYPKGFILGPLAHVVLGKKPQCFDRPEQIPKGWPPNPFWH